MNWLKTKRERVGITSQEDFAARLQLEGITVTRSSISHWENGRFQPPLDNPDFRQALVRILKLSEPEILKLAGFKVEASHHSDEAERAAMIVDQLPPDKRGLAVRLLEQLLA